MKDRKVPPLPADIQLPERVMLEDGAMFVTLPTRNEFEQFWQEHKGIFAFACSRGWCGDDILREDEWVFGVSKTAVVRTALRWKELGAYCEFYDWSKDEPELWREWFDECCNAQISTDLRGEFRQSRIKNGLWSDEDEMEYIRMGSRMQETVVPNTCRGWWQLKGTPDSSSFEDWGGCESLVDPSMSIAEVEKTLQEQLFDAWACAPECFFVHAFNRQDIEDWVEIWRKDEEIGIAEEDEQSDSFSSVWGFPD